MEGYCGANCSECELYKNKKCLSCKETNGCPFGKKCWIANYIDIGGKEKYNELKDVLIKEINNLNISGLKIDELYPLHGNILNLEYILPNGNKIKFLDDEEIYLGNQIKIEELNMYLGVVASTSFILISSYEENGTNPELLLYNKR